MYQQKQVSLTTCMCLCSCSNCQRCVHKPPPKYSEWTSSQCPNSFSHDKCLQVHNNNNNNSDENSTETQIKPSVSSASPDLFDPLDVWIDIPSIVDPLVTPTFDDHKEDVSSQEDLVYHCLKTDTERADYGKLMKHITEHNSTFDSNLGYDFLKRAIVVYMALDKDESEREQAEQDIRALKLATSYCIEKLQIAQAF